jgi:hypothetical protein
MGRCAVRHIVTAKFLVGALFVVTPADAQVSRHWMVCSGQVHTAQPDHRVAACTAVIEAGGETPTNLALAYCDRGVAYQARDQIDRAIADYNSELFRRVLRAIGAADLAIWHGALSTTRSLISMKPSHSIRGPHRPF